MLFMKEIGVESFAWSYVTTKDRKKYFIEESEEDIDAMVNDENKYIRITIAESKNSSIHILKENISTWGKL